MSKYFQDNFTIDDWDYEDENEDPTFQSKFIICITCDGDGINKGHICNICKGKGKLKNENND